VLATVAPPVRTSPQRRTLTLLSVAQVFSGIGAGAVVSTGSLLAVELSGSRAWAGSVTTAMTLGAAVAAPALVRVAVARGRRPALSLGMLVAAAGAGGVVLAAGTRAFWLLVASGLLLGFGSAANLQARFAATDLSAPERRGRDLSLVVWMSTVGAMAGPNLIGLGSRIADRLNVPVLSGLFVLSAGGTLLGLAVIWIGLRPDPLSSQSAAARPERSFRSGTRALVSHPGARAGFIGIVVAHGVMVAVMSMTAVHLTGHGASITIVGLTVSLHIAGMYALSPVMGLLTDRLGGVAVAAGGLVTLVAATLLAGFSGGSHMMTIAGLVLLGVGWSAATVAGSSLIVASVSLEERVNAQGASDSLMSLAGGAGGLLAGPALAIVGYLGLGVAGAMASLLALIAVAGWRDAYTATPRRSHRAAPHTSD
jgi:MFS family permease